MSNIEILQQWMDDNHVTKSMLAKKIGMKVSVVSTAMNIKSNPKKLAHFWIKAKEVTGLDLDVKNLVVKRKKKVVKIPEYIETMLKLHGSTVIPEDVIDCYGEDGVMDHFANIGYKCKMKYETDEANLLYHYLEVIK